MIIPDTLDLIIRMGLSIVCGTLIGLERQIHKGLAGIHTNVLVCVGSCLFLFVSVGIGETNSPSRIAAQVVTGIGFLGAGVIAKDGTNVKGINTAATIWSASAIGCLCGSGMYIIAIIGTAIVSILNYLLRHNAIKTLYKKVEYDLQITCNSQNIDDIYQALTSDSNKIYINKMNVDNRDNKCTITARIILKESSKDIVINSINKISGIDNYSYTVSV